MELDSRRTLVAVMEYGAEEQLRKGGQRSSRVGTRAEGGAPEEGPAGEGGSAQARRGLGGALQDTREERGGDGDGAEGAAGGDSGGCRSFAELATAAIRGSRPYTRPEVRRLGLQGVKTAVTGGEIVRTSVAATRCGCGGGCLTASRVDPAEGLMEDGLLRLGEEDSRVVDGSVRRAARRSNGAAPRAATARAARAVACGDDGGDGAVAGRREAGLRAAEQRGSRPRGQRRSTPQAWPRECAVVAEKGSRIQQHPTRWWPRLEAEQQAGMAYSVASVNDEMVSAVGARQRWTNNDVEVSLAAIGVDGGGVQRCRGCG